MVKQNGPYTAVGPPAEILGRDEALKLYAFCKQGKEGDVQGECPSMFYDIKGNYKWNAWDKVRGMDQDDAKKECIVRAEALLDHEGVAHYDQDLEEGQMKYYNCLRKSMSAKEAAAVTMREYPGWQLTLI